MSKKTASKRVMSVALSTRAEQVLASTKAQTGITHLAFIERLLEWYAAQDPRIRTMILSPYAEVRTGLARMIVEEMQSDPAKEFDPGLHFDGLIHNDYSAGHQRKKPTTPSTSRARH